MTSYIGRKLVGLAILLAIFIVGYNYFWGTPEEQQSSKEILGQVKVLTTSVTNLLISEKEKFDKGKYDAALAKMKDTVSLLKEKALAMGDAGQHALTTVAELEEKEQNLRKELEELHTDTAEPSAPVQNAEAADRQARTEALRQQILDLNQEAEQLSQRLVF